MRKIKTALFILVPLTAIVLFGMAYGVLHTQAGAHWLISSLQGRMTGALQIGQVEGNLGSGLTLNDLDYHDDELAIRADSIRLVVDLDVFPPLVSIGAVRIDTLRVEQLKSSPEPTTLESILAALDLPIDIELTDVLAERVTVIGPDASVIFAADRLGGSLALDDALRVERLFSESEQQTVTLSGELGLVSPYTLTTVADMRLQWIGPDDQPQLNLIQAKVDGNLANELNLDIASESPPVRVAGTLSDPLGDPQWQLTIDSSGLSWPPGQALSGDISIGDLRLTTGGWLNEYQLTAEGWVKTQEIEALQFSIKGAGNFEGMDLASLVLSGEDLELSATGALSWQEAFGLELFTTIQRIEPAKWLEEWPEAQALNGAVNLALTGSGLEFSGLQLEAPGTLFKLSGDGRADFSGGTINADLNWRDFGWPLGSSNPDFGSSGGALKVSGQLDDWTAQVDAALEAPGFPGGNLQVEASGNREQAAMTIVQGQVLGGVISGDAELNWLDHGQWTANLSSSGIELGRMLPDWPARINAELSARGQSEPLEVHLDIHQLDGEFRSIPITARGGVDYRDGLPSFDRFNLELGRSSIEMNGQVLSATGLSFSLRVDELASLDPRGRGQLEASGRLSLNPDTPQLSLDLKGSELAWNNFHAKAISIRDSAQRADTSLADLDIAATQLTVGKQAIDAVNITLHADRDNQTMQFEALWFDMSLTAGISGAFREDGENFLASGWSGQLTSLAFVAQDRLALGLQNPAMLEWSPTSAILGSACLEAGAGASLCAEGEWVENDHVSTLMKLNRFPLNLLQPILETDLEFTQAIDGEFSWSSTAEKPASGNAVFQLSPGEVRYPHDFDSLLKTGTGLLSFNLEQGRLSEGKLLIPLPGMGEVDFDLTIPDVALGLDADISGHLKASLADMDVITLFIPAIDQAGGRFSADLDLAGTIEQPHFSGQLSLVDGLVRHHASGLRLNDINLTGRVLNNDQTTLQGSFRALDGTGNLDGTLDITDILSPRLELNLSGQNLKLFDAPDLTLVAEPDIHLAWQPGLIEIAGGIMIPSANIAPDFIPASTVAESPDLVIVAGDPPDTTTPEEEEIKISIRGNLDVTLGDNVNLELDHARAKLTGKVNFAWKDELLPIANGQYSLVGQINALGQRLEISQGTIGFPNVPADNPHLNIKAEREIFGSSEIRRAGVFVTGTLRRLAMEPYTEPMTNRERARTLLITGSDFNMEQGVGAVDIGFYVAPRIFLSYGIGVFGDDNVVAVRYDLGRGWGVKATSGQRQTGLDLSYTIER